MQTFAALYAAIADRIERAGDPLLPLFARFAFAATLLVYFWGSAATEIGSGIFGIFSPSAGAYAQIFPRQLEAAGFDPSKLTVFHWAVTVAGTWTEFLLPTLIVLGLAARPAALGMIGFIALQTLTDIFGHGLSGPEHLGAWFDGMPDGTILDQRLFWVVTLAIVVVKGAGTLSVDAALRRRLEPAWA